MGENLHASDRLVIASRLVPVESAPLDHRAGGEIPFLIREVRPMSAAARGPGLWKIGTAISGGVYRQLRDADSGDEE